jgi:hypothetical protein
MPVFCDDAFRGDAFRAEDALLVEPADALRLAGARLLVLLVVRDAVRFAFFAFAMCDRPLLLEWGANSHDNKQPGYKFHVRVRWCQSIRVR